ncbi:MAG TPA: peptidase [Cellvibrionales bacterium]|nr:peptidase [Cellvibrionales bacterium]HCX26502.1 peptidase [Cellvibrionales bacterium]
MSIIVSLFFFLSYLPLSNAISSLENTSNLILTGPLKQGGLLVGQVKEGAAVQYQDQLLPITPDGRFIIGLDRDAPNKIELAVINENNEYEYHDLNIRARDYVIQRIEGVAKQYVSPDPVQVKRSRKEAAKVRLARKQQRPQQDFLNGFIWPANGPITGVFGSQRVYNGEPRRPHYGLDVAGPIGAPVIAPAAGLVTLAEPDLFFSGGTLIIDHGHGLSSTFLHLSKLLVTTGDSVTQGQDIAEMGATGRVTGPHLDWRMNWTDGKTSVRIDPELLVEVGGNQSIQD